MIRIRDIDHLVLRVVDLDKMLRFIVDNHLPISTPQMFLGDRRLCDEDTDMGLAYTMKRLAPGLRSK